MKINIEENLPTKYYPIFKDTIEGIIKQYNINAKKVNVHLNKVEENVYIRIGWNDGKINGEIDFTIDFYTKEIKDY